MQRRLPNRRFTLALAGTLVLAGMVPPAFRTLWPDDPPSLHIDVDLDSRVLYLHRGDTLTDTFDITVGAPKHPTPKGQFEIHHIVWNPGWVPPDADWAKNEERKDPDDPENPMKRAKLFFREPDYFIHGTGDIASLGEAASHGCIRMSPAAVTKLARIVQEHGGAKRSSAWYKEIIRTGDTQEIRLPNPVTMTIR